MTQQATLKFDSKERNILITSCFGHFMSHYNMLAFPAVVLPLSVHLGKDMMDVVGISFLMYLLFGVTALPWGVGADRLGAKPFFLIFYLGAGCSSLATALSIDSLQPMMLSLAGLGLFSGIYHPIGLGLISKEVRNVSMGMGYNGMFGNLGLAMAPASTGIICWLWGPKASYMFLGGLNFLGVIIMLFFPITQARVKDKTLSEENSGNLQLFLILLVAMTLGGIAYRGSTVILPPFLSMKGPGIFQWLSSLTSMEIPKNLVATSVTSVIFLVGIAGQFMGGRVAGRFDLRLCYLSFHLIIVPVAFLISIASDIPLVALAIIYFFFLLGMQPIENTLVARYTPKKLRHSAYGTKFVATFGIGALAVKMVQGIETTSGIESVFKMLSLVSLSIVTVILIIIYKTKRTD
jgi:MFS family permease